MSAHALKGYIQCPHNSYLRYAPNDCFIIHNYWGRPDGVAGGKKAYPLIIHKRKNNLNNFWKFLLNNMSSIYAYTIISQRQIWFLVMN